MRTDDLPPPAPPSASSAASPDEYARERLSAVLDRLGWEHEYTREDLCVARPWGGSTSVLLVAPGDDFADLSSLIVRCAWRRDGVNLEMVNTFNFRFRFVRAFLDDDADPVLQMDLLLDGPDDRSLPNALRKFHELVLTFEGYLSAFQGLVGGESPELN